MEHGMHGDAAVEAMACMGDAAVEAMACMGDAAVAAWHSWAMQRLPYGIHGRCSG
jgi:hypothetical protein